MNYGCSGGSDERAARRDGIAHRVADALALAASPTFAIMALVNGIIDGGAAQMPGMSSHVSSMSGMVTMYLLMSGFHAGAWLKRLSAGVTFAPVNRSQFP